MYTINYRQSHTHTEIEHSTEHGTTQMVCKKWPKKTGTFYRSQFFFRSARLIPIRWFLMLLFVQIFLLFSSRFIRGVFTDIRVLSVELREKKWIFSMREIENIRGKCEWTSSGKRVKRKLCWIIVSLSTSKMVYKCGAGSMWNTQ